ncbi:MAG: SRPBCC family protein [Pseudonocardia sp.]|nr:SRPBCC family protein [Pseudonocardia sp.]
MAPRNQRWWLTQDSVTLDIDADAHVLYGMVADLPRMGEWSPECASVTWEGDAPAPVVGTTFVGHNAVGPGRRIRYSRHGSVLVAEPGRAFGFVTDEGGRPSTVWHYRFEALADGRTRVTESYEVRWIPVWARILDVPLNRHKELLAGMRTTLERLRAKAEAIVPQGSEGQAQP